MSDHREELNPERRSARRYLARENKGQIAMPGMESPQAEKKRRGARDSAKKKLNKLASRGKER